MIVEQTRKSSEKWYKIISALLIAGSFVLGILAYPRLPDRIPIHWNLAGEPNNYTNALGGAFLLPGIMLAVYLLMWVVPRIDPKRNNFLLMGKAYWMVRFSVILFLCVLQIGIIATALGYVNNMPHLVMLGIGILIMVVGNYMGKIKYNYSFGIRTPWTLANEEVWYKTHRAVGPFWVIGGFIILVSGFLPRHLNAPVISGIITALAIASYGYSYLVFQRVSKDQ